MRRLWRVGRISIILRITRERLPVEQRFWQKVDKRKASECWPWRAFIDKGGYGRINAGGNSGEILYAHRLSWELANGPIPTGLVIDHLCRTRHCVNPAHMEPVTNETNLLRGHGPTMQSHRERICHNGHDLRIYGRFRKDIPGRLHHCVLCAGIRTERRRLAQRRAGLPVT